jgi:hypothetical protein
MHHYFKRLPRVTQMCSMTSSPRKGSKEAEETKKEGNPTKIPMELASLIVNHKPP